MSVLDNLNRIKSCKDDIKQALTDRGVDMTNVAFTEYATKINEIPSGGGDYLDMRMNMSTYYSTAESVPEYAFYNMSGLQTVNLPNCSYVGSNAFQRCISLQSVNLPNLSKLGDSAFYRCTSLQSIDLPKVLSGGEDAFAYCSNLQSVNLPNHNSKLGGYMFMECTSLQSIDLPKVEILGWYTFKNCYNLSYVSAPTAAVVDQRAFDGCSALTVLDLRSIYSCKLSDINAFSRTPFTSGIGSIYVHAAHLSQFQNATNWTYFSKCLVGVGDPTRPLLSFDNGRVYGDTEMIYSTYLSYLGINKSSVSSLDLPFLKRMWVNTYGEHFSYYSNLTTVNLPMYEYVDRNAFYGCKSLATISLPMCRSVGRSAFDGCLSLTTVNLPMCEYVNNGAFYNCSSLQSIDLPICSYLGDSAFFSCLSLTTVNLPKCEYVGSSTFAFCKSLQSIDLPMCSYVDRNAFYYCSSITTVNLPMCEYVGTMGFYFCSSLATISLPMCSYLGERVFNDNLKTLYIGTSLSTVCVLGGELALNNFRYISSIFVPMSLVDAYKSAQNWSVGASKIFGI